MYNLLDECPAIRSWFPVVLKEIAILLDRRLVAMDLSSDMLHDDRGPRGSSTRLRTVDEDLHQAIRDAIAGGRATHARALARATGVLPVGTAACVDDKTLVEYQAEGWLLAKQLGDITVCPDATRCGNPAEESMQIPIWLDRVSRGLILPNQVNNTGGRGCQSQLGPVSDAREICNIYVLIKVAYSQYVRNM